LNVLFNLSHIRYDSVRSSLSWNQCLSPLKMWVRIPLNCSRYNFMW